MNRPYVSFAEIKDRVPIPDALEVHGILNNFQRKGDTLSGVCPLPAHRHGPLPNPEQFKINRREGVWLWHCFGDCQKGGDVVELVKELTGYDNSHVRFWFAEHFGDRLNLGQRNGSKAKKDTAHATSEEASQAAPHAPSNLPPAAAPLKPLRFQLNLDPAVPYLQDRGLAPETIKAYGLGLCQRGVLKGYVAIPVYDSRHAKPRMPVAYLGRWPGEDFDEAAGRPRYKWPEGFPKSQVVYGLAEALANDDHRPLIVVEGPFKVYYLVQAGLSTAVACFGSSLSDEQAASLISTKRPIVLLFDGDDAGLNGMQAAAAKLIASTFVRIVQLPSNVQPDALLYDQLASLLS